MLQFVVAVVAYVGSIFLPTLGKPVYGRLVFALLNRIGGDEVMTT